MSFLVDSIPDEYKTQDICDIVVSLYPLLIIHCPNKYITQTMCGEAVHYSLASLKLIPDCLPETSKMIKKLYTALYADDNIVYFNENSGDVAFSCNKMSIFSIDVNNIYIGNNFVKNDPDTIFDTTFVLA